MTTTTVRIATVHAGCSLPVQLALLDAIEGAMRDVGAERVWIDPSCTTEMVVLAAFAPRR